MPGLGLGLSVGLDNVAGYITGGKHPFSPLDIPNIKIWNKSSHVTKDGLNLISAFDDLVGLGATFTEPIAASQPEQVLENGLYHAKFDGINDLIISPGNLQFNNQSTIFIVATNSPTRDFMNIGGTNGVRFYWSSTTILRVRYRKANSSYTTSIIGNSPATPFVRKIIIDNQNDQYRESINGAVESIVNVLNGGMYSNNGGNIVIGQSGIGSGYYDGKLYEVLLYDRLLTTTEVGNIETYLADKYSIIL